MDKITTATSVNKDDPPLIKVILRLSRQKMAILSLMVVLFAALVVPQKVIAEDYPPTAEISGLALPSPQQKINTKELSLASVQGTALIELSDPETVQRKKAATKGALSFKKWVLVTAYSSTVDQCDSTPFITASGTHVHDGTIAANFLRFGTKVKFPALYGDKIFTVEDRMKSNRKVDIWFPTRAEALKFGAKRTMMEIVIE